MSEGFRITLALGRIKQVLTALLFLGFLGSCQKDKSSDDINIFIDNERFSNPEDYISIVDSTYLDFWKSLQHNEPNMPISVMGHGVASAWGNWGMRELSGIPEAIALNNEESYRYREIIGGAWNGLYQVLGAMNDLLTVISANQDFVQDRLGVDGLNEVIANAKALQGLSFGYLSLLYDQAYIVDENSDLASATFSDYNNVNDAAIEKLSEAISLFKDSNLTMTGWNGLVYDGDNAANLLSAFSAKFEVLKARNPSETQNLDWGSVLQKAQTGFEDLAPLGDGGVEWWHRILIQGQDSGWMRIHQKIVKMMNPDKPDGEVPYPYPDGVVDLPEILNPIDNRMVTDFTYIPLTFHARGSVYMASNYTYTRYADYRVSLEGPMQFLTADEVSLIKAEAIIRTGGDKVIAANLINNTRVNRGGLQPLSGVESNEILLEAISYERFLEFTFHGACNIWFYRRLITPVGNRDRSNVYYLQPKTARHLPVPGFELRFKNLPVYTFGGTQPEQ